MRKYYVYKHVRHDKNEVFYIGVGTLKDGGTFEQKYHRAFVKESRKNRNIHWFNIVNKTSYSVEIIFESDNKRLVLDKEVELIKFYGRRDLGRGTLVNKTDGGEHNEGRVVSEETKNKLRILNLGKPSGMKGRTGILCHASKQVYVYSNNGEYMQSFDSYTEASQNLKTNLVCMRRCLNKFNDSHNGFRFFTEFQGDKISIFTPKPQGKRVIAFDRNWDFICTCQSIKEAGRKYNVNPWGIQKSTKKPWRTACGLHWISEDFLSFIIKYSIIFN